MAARVASPVPSRRSRDRASLRGAGPRDRPAGRQGWPAGRPGCDGRQRLAAQDVVLGWMRSDGHCAIIMEPLFEDVGVGTYEAPEHDLQALWTADFGG